MAATGSLSACQPEWQSRRNLNHCPGLTGTLSVRPAEVLLRASSTPQHARSDTAKGPRIAPSGPRAAMPAVQRRATGRRGIIHGVYRIHGAHTYDTRTCDNGESENACVRCSKTSVGCVCKLGVAERR